MHIDDTAVSEACNILGWPGLRPVQREVLEPLLTGKDIVAVLPTSGGKSGIYQIPALARSGMVVVISPLVALMRDQVTTLRKAGVAAFSLNSHCSAVEKRTALDAIEHGECQLLYMSPERLQGVDKDFFRGSEVQLFAIDEAHCISSWGFDFRPAYLKIGRNLDRFGNVQKVALTATATPKVIEDIVKVLKMDNTHVSIIKSPDRGNILYGVAGKDVDIVRLVERGGLPSLVYGSTRKAVEETSHYLKRYGYKCDFYHAGRTKSDRARVQEAFLGGDLDIITATCAFGMGIDHPGIRSVVHLEMSTSIEAFMQESGRAGRDGKPAIAICRATTDTLDVAMQLTALTWPPPVRVRQLWVELQKLFESATGKAVGAGRLQMTNVEIANTIGLHYDELEISSCLRILANFQMIRRIPYQDRAVRLVMLSGAATLTGRKQKDVRDRLLAHADTQGMVEGSVAFFANVIGLNKSYALKMSRWHALRIGTWEERVQLVVRLVGPDDLEIDDAWIATMRRRALSRIAKAKGFLFTPGCRRSYLLSYFGDESGGEPVGRCCDRCPEPSAPADS